MLHYSRGEKMKNVFAQILCLLALCVSVGAYGEASCSHNYRYNHNRLEHWNICEYCGAEEPNSRWPHDYYEGHCYCGALLSDYDMPTSCAHSYLYRYDANKHWRECIHCGQIDSETLGQHWRYCNSNHCFDCGMGLSIGDYHFEHVGTCGAPVYHDSGSHQFTWLCCGLVERQEHVSSDFGLNFSSISDTEHSYECTCHGRINGYHSFHWDDEDDVCWACGYPNPNRASDQNATARPTSTSGTARTRTPSANKKPTPTPTPRIDTDSAKYVSSDSDTVINVVIKTVGIAQSSVLIDGQQRTVSTKDLSFAEAVKETQKLAIVFAPLTGKATLRRSPSSGAHLIDNCKAGSIVPVLAVEGDYAVTLYQGRKGYIKTSSLQFSPARDAIGTATVDNAGRTVNLRLSRSTSAHVVCRLESGRQVVVLSKTANWYEVETNGMWGYIKKGFLRED